MVSFLAFGLGRDQRKSGARAMHKLIGLAVVVLLAVGFAAALVFAWRNAAMIGEASSHLPSGIPEANRSAGRPGSLPFGSDPSRFRTNDRPVAQRSRGKIADVICRLELLTLDLVLNV